MGHRAGVYRTLLTHFSQRYPKVPVIDDSFRSSTCIAFDLMTVNLQGLATPPTASAIHGEATIVSRKMIKSPAHV